MRNDKPRRATPIKIAGAIRIRPAEWHTAPSRPKDRLTVEYSTRLRENNRARAAQFLRKQGFQEANALRVGFDAWQAVGGHIEPKKSSPPDLPHAGLVAADGRPAT